MIGPVGKIGAKDRGTLFDIEIEGEKQTQRFMRGVIDLTPPEMKKSLTQFGDYMQKRFAERFSKETGRTKWAQLKPATVKARARRYGYYAAPSKQKPRHMILQWTGELQQSFIEKGGFGNVFDVTADSLAVGSLLDKAVWHMSGRPRKKLPRRTVAFLDRADNYVLTGMFRSGIERAIQKSKRWAK